FRDGSVYERLVLQGDDRPEGPHIVLDEVARRPARQILDIIADEIHGSGLCALAAEDHARDVRRHRADHCVEVALLCRACWHWRGALTPLQAILAGHRSAHAFRSSTRSENSIARRSCDVASEPTNRRGVTQRIVDIRLRNLTFLGRASASVRARSQFPWAIGLHRRARAKSS